LVIRLASVAAALSGQRTWTVARDRPADFADIPPAIVAATAGDTIEVWPNAEPYSGFTLDKGLTVIGMQPITVGGAISVQGLRAHERAVLSRFAPHEFTAAAFGGFPVVVGSCRGSVHLQYIESYGSRHGRALTIVDSDHVTIADSSFQAGASWRDFFRTDFLGSSDAFAIVRSTVTMLRSNCGGANVVSYPFYGQVLHASHPAGQLSSSRLLLSDSRVVGAGGLYGTFCEVFVYGTNAVVASNSTIAITGANALILGGRTNGGWICYSYEAHGVVSDAATIVYLGDVPPQNVHSTGQIVGAALPWLRSTDAPPGGTLDVTLDFAAGGPFVTHVSLPGSPLPIFPPVGVWIDPALWAQVDSGVMAGSRHIQVQVSTIYSIGLPLIFQSAFLVGGAVAVSMPAVSILH